MTARLIIAATIGLLLLLGAGTVLRDWIAVDRCLDAGGQWDAVAERCEPGH